MFETLAKLLISWCPERGSNPHAPIKARRSLSIRREIRAPRAHRGEIPDCSANYARICRVSGKKLPHLATLALAALAGCGGGGGDAPAAPPTPPTSAPPTSTCKATVRVQMYGDSTQVAAYRWGYLQAELDTRYGTGKVVLILQAVSGTNSQQLIAGTDGLNTPWPGTVDADIAFVNHAINDEGYHHDDLPTFAHDMAVFAQTTKGGVRMVLETPNPIASWRNTPDAPWADITRRAAEHAGVPVADVQAYVLGLPGWEEMLSDGIHPTEDLQSRIARDVTAPTLEPLIDGMICK
jgi:acyl-CoA thioesterase-1